MEASKSLWGAFFAFFVLLSLVSVFFVGIWSLAVLFVLSCLFVIILWGNRVVVPENWNYIFEWNGEKIEPLKPGLHFPFPWLGFLQPKGMVPTNRQTLRVLSGESKGCSEEIIQNYPYGIDSDIEPSSGDKFKALYHVETQCINPAVFAYAHDDTYSYVVSLIDSRIRNFLGSKTGEDISDNFSSFNWRRYILNKKYLGQVLSKYIEEKFGLEIIEIISIDIILTPEVEGFRRKLDEAIRDKEIYAAKADAAEEMKRFSVKKDEITKNTINAVKATAGVRGDQALNFMLNSKKLETMEVVSKNGGNIFIDGAGGGNFAAGAGFSWGFSSHAKVEKKKGDEEPEKKEIKIIKKEGGKK